MVEVLNDTVGGLAVYSCQIGFQLTGDSTLICGGDGEWVGEIPACDGQSKRVGWVRFRVCVVCRLRIIAFSRVTP